MDPTGLVLSWSEVKTWQRCQKQYDYKYVQELQPKKRQLPLYKGSWVHACLETHYRDGDWKIGHQIYLDEYNKLFEEERDALNTIRGKRNSVELPQLIERIIKSYLWYYREDGWKVIATEKDLRTELKGVIGFKGRTDLIIEDAEGLLWDVDHKTAGSIPDAGAYHAMDPQLMVYPWAIEKELGIKLAGIIYNYVKSKPPSIPRVNKDGSLSRRKVVTDYPTLYRFLKKEGYDPNDFADILRPLQYKSPFLRRYKLPREAFVTKEVLRDFYNSGMEIHNKRALVDSGASVSFIRNITKDCARFCSFHDLCRQELNGFDTSILRRTEFTLRKEEDGSSFNPELELEEDES